MAVLDDGVVGRVELTACVDVATRTLCDAVLRPVATKAVDAALLLARMLVPAHFHPGWPEALAMAHSQLPYARLVRSSPQSSRPERPGTIMSSCSAPSDLEDVVM
jgi:hypothetical protein